MVELRSDALVFTFPDVHRDAELRIDFQRTLRIPDDGRKYDLPPGLGRFPLRHVDDFAERIPTSWRARGGVMLPMYQSEALWLHFTSPKDYPFAVKVATGKINAVTGDNWSDGLHRNPQDYMSVPGQPWLDGYCVEKGLVRQFVAMPLGAGYSAEEQITGEAEHGGIQIVAYPVKAKVWERMRRRVPLPAAMYFRDQAVLCESDSPSAHYDMGLAPGGRMEQTIYDDSLQFADWDLDHRGRCFVHLANSLVWQSVTGMQPPNPPLTAEAYTRAGMPWYDYYDADRGALEGAEALAKMKSVADLGHSRGDMPLPENESVDPGNVVKLGPKASRYEVREGTF